MCAPVMARRCGWPTLAPKMGLAGKLGNARVPFTVGMP